MHWLPTDSFYLEEAYQRIHYYEPPFAGVYFEPWLWYDGDQHGGYNYFLWEGFITARMALPAPVTIEMWGDYTPATGQGTVNVYLQNDSTTTINGRVIIVITEDSLFYIAPNGNNWHNHVPRDYLPDHNGTMVSIPPGGYSIVTQPFTINSIWNDDFCTILAWIQNDSMYVDSTKEIWQGAMKKVTELGIAETEPNTWNSQLTIKPNPCHDRLTFTFDLLPGTEFKFFIYDILGRQVKEFNGVCSDQDMVIDWNLFDDQEQRLTPGVYFYDLVSVSQRITGKVVVK